MHLPPSASTHDRCLHQIVAACFAHRLMRPSFLSPCHFDHARGRRGVPRALEPPHATPEPRCAFGVAASLCIPPASQRFAQAEHRDSHDPSTPLRCLDYRLRYSSPARSRRRTRAACAVRPGRSPPPSFTCSLESVERCCIDEGCALDSRVHQQSRASAAHCNQSR